MSRKGRGRSRSCVVHYQVMRKWPIDFDERPVEKLLLQAQRDGVVTQFDTGRGHLVWFNGFPGPELRALRKEVERVVAENTRFPEARFSPRHRDG
jgi:hypothetical protein